MKQSLISVCIPVYNGEKYVAETINSVRQQTYQNIEILIQDNASTDKTDAILRKLAEQDARVIVQRNEKNYGMAGNWNLAMNRARGNYVMLLSADDLLLPEFVERCLTAFSEKKVDAVTTNHFYLKNGDHNPRKLPVKGGLYQDFSHRVLLLNPFSINFTLLEKKLVEKLRVKGNLFAKSYYTCDYDLWIRLALSSAKVEYLEECLGIYRVHDENLSKQAKRMRRQTALTIFSHKEALKGACPLAYRITLLRFVARCIRDGLRHRSWDGRLIGALKGEFLR